VGSLRSSTLGFLWGIGYVALKRSYTRDETALALIAIVKRHKVEDKSIGTPLAYIDKSGVNPVTVIT